MEMGDGVYEWARDLGLDGVELLRVLRYCIAEAQMGRDGRRGGDLAFQMSGPGVNVVYCILTVGSRSGVNQNSTISTDGLLTYGPRQNAWNNFSKDETTEKGATEKVKTENDTTENETMEKIKTENDTTENETMEKIKTENDTTENETTEKDTTENLR
ncbi:hypothetical protein H633G_02623 [Metarhizium anisopliae BRIP 53284]|nr:hypothetical protein H633G_02623 [Metarhizium anisopliae BRIP 53284]